MKGNWEITEYAYERVAIDNYYGAKTACIIVATPYAGILARYFCPVKYKEKVAKRAKKFAAKSYATVSVNYPLPKVEDCPVPIFNRYVAYSFIS
jgi:hypothetical protein